MPPIVTLSTLTVGKYNCLICFHHTYDPQPFILVIFLVLSSHSWIKHKNSWNLFQTADLTNANLEGANLEGANLKVGLIVLNLSLYVPIWTSLILNMNPSAQFFLQGAKLTNANLKGANLQRAYLRHVNLRDTVSNLMVHHLRRIYCSSHKEISLNQISI